jgi:hypothetical protein
LEYLATLSHIYLYDKKNEGTAPDKIERLSPYLITGTNMSVLLLSIAKFFCIFTFSLLLSRFVVAILRKPRERIYRNMKRECQFNTLEDAVIFVLQRQKIYDRKGLEDWCGGKSREPFYEHVKRFAPIRWQLVSDPRKYVRDIYQTILPGYTNARVRSS